MPDVIFVLSSFALLGTGGENLVAYRYSGQVEYLPMSHVKRKKRYLPSPSHRSGDIYR
jgi:hypothetical protein